MRKGNLGLRHIHATRLSGALFVGAYSILDEWVFPADPRQHILHDPAFGENDDHEHLRYNLERVPEFEDLVGRVYPVFKVG
jgi:hypothetical protein